ncbi:MAG: xanthine dehydrogenase family protein molybdopterin-binding subunit [Acidimicrobiales bacterium]|nr:xanthine dehydrogenase family protein molybdopterin-binding subunit [Acidimicrobiales bacterium]
MGTSVRRVEDPRFLTGRSCYVDDVPIPGALHAVFVRSTVAHARIKTVDTTLAQVLDGVVGVFGAAEIGDRWVDPFPGAEARMRRPLLAHDVVRFVGEPVAVVVAEDLAVAMDGAEMVVVDYEPQAVVTGPEREAGGAVLFSEVGSNRAARFGTSPPEGAFDDCAVTVDVVVDIPRMAPAPLEPRRCAARWLGGGLTQWASVQSPHAARRILATFHGLALEAVRVISPDVGGGFGAKVGFYTEDLLLGLLARRLDRPVRWAETRSENLVGMYHGRAQRQRIRLGGTAEGIIEMYDLEVCQDGGAYPSVTPYVAGNTIFMASGPYRIPRVWASGEVFATNTAPVGAYRGAGRPEAAIAIERAIDIYAAELGIDPVEVRRRNLIPPDCFPYRAPTGAVYDTGDYPAVLDRALAMAGYAELRAEQRRRRAAADPFALGVGVSIYVEVTNRAADAEFASVEVTEGGRAVVRTGSHAHGQGHETAWAMIVAAGTGLAIEQIEVRHGDTDEVPRGPGTAGSKSLQIGGSATFRATEVLVERARELAADLLEAAVEDVMLDARRGIFHVAGVAERGLTWTDVVEGAGGPISADFDFKPDSGTYPFGADVAVVEVDTLTGRVDLKRLVAVDDAGTVLNPLLFTGQIHGGLAAGAALALGEAYVYAPDGTPLTSTLADYAMFSAAELPSFETAANETPTPLNPLGAKGVGECGTVGATPAVQSAVVDALAHLGIRHIDLPLTPQRVWSAIQAAQNAAAR